MKERRKVELAFLLLALLGLFVVAGEARAHNRAVHQKSTETAYLIMKMATLPKYTVDHLMFKRPASVPLEQQADWDTFVKGIGDAALWYGTLPSQLPLPASMSCWWPIEGGPTPGMTVEQSHAMTGPLNQVPFTVSLDYLISGSMCGIPAEPYKPGGAAPNPFDDVSADRTGNILGFWTADVDTHDSDSRMWVRPTNIWGIQQMKEASADVWDAGAGAVLIPIYCAWECFWSIFGMGNCKKCIDAAEEIASENNPVKAIDSLVGGVDANSSVFTGLWHHVKAHGPHSDTYDTRQGYFGEEAYTGILPGPSELVTMAFSDLVGLSVKPGEAQGVKHYQIYGANDGHPDSVERSDEDWQWTTWPHVPFCPVDNLGFYGWREFRDSPGHPVKMLGFALHAIDDASTVHHMSGTFGWGHEPFEDAELALWPRTMCQGFGQEDQVAQINTIAEMAYHLYRGIQKWQAENGTKDVPLRILIDDLASTVEELVAAASTSPYSYVATELKALGADEMAMSLYTNDNDLLLEVIHPATEAGLAVKIAFLFSAAELLAPEEVVP
jgi:hypothetical protein